MSESTPSAIEPAVAGPDIVARAGQYYRNTRYIIFLVLIAMGFWFAWDGFKAWPEGNRKIAALVDQHRAAEARGDQDEMGRINAELKNYTQRSEWDLTLQKILAFTLPVLGVVLLWRALSNSRGEYRLSGDRLSVPGHPTILLSDIKSLNNDLWDRKGIAWFTYETADGASGEIRLDDFVYDRPPTDAIYDQIAARFPDNNDDDSADESTNETAEEA